MLGKLFKKNQSATNIGTHAGLSEDDIDSDLLKDAYITFTNLESELSRKISPKLTIGREVGELLIDNDSVSPRHCTLLVSRDVVSIIDHSSEEGTFVNKKQLAAGKMFILNPKDKLKLGKLTAKIEFKHTPVIEADEEIEDEFSEDSLVQEVAEMPTPNTEMLSLETPLEEDEEEEIQSQPMSEQEKEQEYSMMTSKGIILEKHRKENLKKASKSKIDIYEPEMEGEDDSNKDKPSFFSKLRFWKKKEKKAKVVAASGKGKKISRPKMMEPPATSGLIRMVAFGLDTLFAMTLHTIASPIEEFEAFFVSFPNTLREVIEPVYLEYLKPLVDEASSASDIVSDIINMLAESELIRLIIPYFFFVIALRIITSLLFGLSLGQAVMGIKVYKGSFLLKRIKGAIREFLGLITLPFLVFDIPTLFGKRSLKEVLTFTRIFTPHPLGTNITIFIWVPLAVLIYVCAPVLEGFEAIEPVVVDTQGEKKIIPWTYDRPVSSEFLGIKFDQTEQMKVVPVIDISIKDKKKFRKYGLYFYNLETKQGLSIFKDKGNIKLLSLFREYKKENPLTWFYEPHIQEFVESMKLNNTSFKAKIDKQDITNISQEFRELLKNVYELDLVTLPNFLMTEGPFIRSHVNLKKRFESIFPHKIESVTFSNFGNISGLLFAHDIGKERLFTYLTQMSLSPDLYLFSKDVSNIRVAKDFNMVRFLNGKEQFEFADAASAYVDSMALKKEISEFERMGKIIIERFKSISKSYIESNQDLTELRAIIGRNMTSLEIDGKKDTEFYRGLVLVLNSLQKEE